MGKDFEYLYKSFVMEDLASHKSYTYLSEISVITIKSLVPSMTKVGNELDYRRYVEELKLWMMYRSGFNKALYRLNELDYNIYFGDYDDSIIARIVPLVVANKDLDFLIDQVIKNILFTTGNIETLLRGILSSVIYFYGFNKCPGIEEGLKSIIINLSQSEFMENYGRYYRLKPRDEKKFKIQFELEKIKIINILNDNQVKGCEKLVDMIQYIKASESPLSTIEAKILERFEGQTYLNIDRFYINLSDYLLKLRSSRLDPEQLIIKDYILPDIFDFNKGDKFFHSLLGEGIVLKKKENLIQVKTKSGYYNLKK